MVKSSGYFSVTQMPPHPSATFVEIPSYPVTYPLLTNVCTWKCEKHLTADLGLWFCSLGRVA